jgi:hypothetical protein
VAAEPAMILVLPQLTLRPACFASPMDPMKSTGIKLLAWNYENTT